MLEEATEDSSQDDPYPHPAAAELEDTGLEAGAELLAGVVTAVEDSGLGVMMMLLLLTTTEAGTWGVYAGAELLPKGALEGTGTDLEGVSVVLMAEVVASGVDAE